MPSDLGVRGFNNTYGFGSQISESYHNSTLPRVVYFNGKVHGKSSFTAGFGSKAYVENASPIGTGKIKNFDYANGKRGIWDRDSTNGWETKSGSVGNAHATVVEIYDDSNNIWFPASAFGGMGLNTYNSQDGKHATYFTHMCTVWHNGSSYRHSSQSYQSSETSGTKFFQVKDSYAEEIRDFGDSWRFYGIVFRLYNSSNKPGTKDTTCKLYNVKLYPWFKDMAHSGQDKWIPPSRRSRANMFQNNFPAADFEFSIYDPN